MPIDPRIIAGISPAATFDPIAAQNAATNAAEVKMRGELIRQKFQEDQQARQDALAARQALTEVQGDPEKAIPVLLSRGLVGPATALQEEINKSKKAKADAAKMQLDTAKAHTEFVSQVLQGMNEQTYPLGRKMLISALGPDAEAELPEQYNKDAIDALVASGRSAKEFLDAQQKKLEPIDTVDEAGNPVKKFVTPQEGVSYPIYQKPTAEGKAPNVGTFDDYVTRTYGANPTPAQILKARKEYFQADDKATNFAAADTTKLTPQGLDMAALNYRKTGVMPTLGMGDRVNRQAIINRAAALTATDMQRIEQGGADLAGNKAEYGANAKSLAQLTTQRNNIHAFEATAGKNIDIFLEQAGKVVDSGSPLANRPLRYITGSVLGSPNQAAFDAARQVAINEIAKVTTNPNLSGQLSDTARHEIEAFNPNSATLKQSVAVMRVLKRDMQNRIDSIDQEIANVKGNIHTQGLTPTHRYNTATGKIEAIDAR